MENPEDVDFDNTPEEIESKEETAVETATPTAKEEEAETTADGKEENSRKRKRDDQPPKTKRLKVEIRDSKEAKDVETKITRILQNSKDRRCKMDDIQGKISKRFWTRYYDKFKLEVRELLELFGTKYTFEIIEGETWVVLNEQPAPAMFPPPMGFCPPVFGAPFPPPHFMGMPPPFFPPNFMNKGSAFMCEICMIELNSERVREAHFAGKKHKRKAAILEDQKKNATSGGAPAGGSIFPSDIPFKPPTPHPAIFFPYECFLCNVPINSKKTEDIHVNGKKHQRKLRDRQGAGFGFQGGPNLKPGKQNKDGFVPYMCTFCNAQLTSPKMEDAHNKGRKHQKRVKMRQQQAMVSPFPVMPIHPGVPMGAAGTGKMHDFERAPPVPKTW